MKPRTTLTLVALGGAFFAYIWFIESEQKTTRELADSQSKVIETDEASITSLCIKNGESLIELSKTESGWKMIRPLTDRADEGTISQLLSTATNLRHDSKIDISSKQSEERLKEFGVNQSDLHLTLKTGGKKEIELILGKDSAIEGKLYARLNGKNDVYVVRNALRNLLTKKADEFRDKKLSETPPALVTKVHVKTAEGEFELERKSNHWDFIRPLRARAADQKVNDILAAVLSARVGQFLDETPTPEQALTEPRATVTMSVEGQKDPLILQLGAPPSGEEQKDKAFAKLSSRAAVTVLSNSATDPLIKARPNDLRDRKLIRVPPDIVDRITVESQSGVKMVMARKGEGWILKGNDTETPINEALPTRVLAGLQTAEATNFVADIAPNLAQYSLAEPRLRVTLSSYSSENTPESKAGEKVLATLLFSPIEGDNAYCKLEEEPFIVAAPKSLIEEIPTDPVCLQPLEVLNLKTDGVISITSRRGFDTITIEKHADSWKRSGGEGAVNQDAVQNVLRLVSGLRTTKWIGPTDQSAHGLEKPEFEITFESKKNGEAGSVKIAVGSLYEGENYLHATASNKPGTFSLNKADKDILFSNLLQ